MGVLRIGSNLGGYTVANDMAKPDDLATLGEFQGLQRALNYAIRYYSLSLNELAVDGILGPYTVKATQVVLRKIAGSGAWFNTGSWFDAAASGSVKRIADNAAELGMKISNAITAPYNKTPVPAGDNVPTGGAPKVDAKGVVATPGSGGGGDGWLMYAGGGLIAVALWMWWRKRKK